MAVTERWDADQWRKDFSAPLPGAPNFVCRVPAKPLRFELWGAHEYLLPTETRPQPHRESKLHDEQHKGHNVYTGSGHRCGVIPSSSVWCGGLPLGLMMNSTEEEQPREACSCGGVLGEEWLRLYWL